MSHAVRATLAFLAFGLIAGPAVARKAQAPAAGPAAAAPAAAPAPVPPTGPVLLPGMGSHHRTVTTSSPEAQKWFNQGLTLAFAFNHDEAIRSFREAARLDPECAMAWWGIALCNGPHINNPTMDEEHSRAADEAIRRARAATGRSSAEAGLIDALARRYAWPAPSDRSQLDHAYAGAMRRYFQQHQDDADAATLFAESLMDLRPWDLWTIDGKPQPGTLEILDVLRRALAINPNHPGANHLWIHATEASPDPVSGLEAARRLSTLVPGAGHLVHMPGHVYARLGRWEEAAAANLQAIEADKTYRALSPRQGFYNVYMAHDHQFLAYVRMMQGRGAEALAASREMGERIPDEAKKQMAFVIDGYLSLPYEVLVRFGMWDDILKEPKPADDFPISIAMWHCARGIAHAALKQRVDAREEQAAFHEARKNVAPQAIVGNNPAAIVLDVASMVLDGEIALGEGDLDHAAKSLRQAAALEDRMRYNEPPDWVIPVRHPLGAVLLKAGRAAEAERVYREDLRQHPDNGWSLQGLADALKAQGRDGDARAVRKQFEKAWAGADAARGTSCLCVR